MIEQGQMIRWFGLPWVGAHVCDDPAWEIAVPVGAECAFCFAAIEASDQGLCIGVLASDTVLLAPYHLACFRFCFLGEGARMVLVRTRLPARER